MRIAITAGGETLAASVDDRFGRAPCFVLYDLDAEQFTVVPNQQNLQAAQGAGIQAAQNVARAGADAVLTGHVGPKAFRALTAAGIAVFTGVSGTVAEALAAYRAGRLEPAAAPNASGH